MSTIEIAAVIVLAIVVIVFVARRYRFAIARTESVVSGRDGMAYRVHPSHVDATAAADTLAELNARVIALLRHLRAKYVRGPVYDTARRAAVAALLRRYNPDNLAENSPKDPSGDTSYAVDKGALVAICLRERDPAASGDPLLHDIHDLGVLTFVTLHEMAHLSVEAIDHPTQFWAAFKFLLEEAELADIYYSPDFAKAPLTYCGVRIDYNPRWDNELAPI